MKENNKTKLSEGETVQCECGRIEPIENARFDKEGLHSCDKCYIDMLTEKLSEGSGCADGILNIIHTRKTEYHKRCLIDEFINGRFWEAQELYELIKLQISSLPSKLSNQTNAVEFAEWLLKNTVTSTNKVYFVYKGQNYYTTQELYLIFQKKKDTNL